MEQLGGGDSYPYSYYIQFTTKAMSDVQNGRLTLWRLSLIFYVLGMILLLNAFCLSMPC